MKSSRKKRGQFVIIAVMLTAIMMVSIGALMHGAITYYKHEPWEEYSTLIGDIEINSRRLVELSLADYSNSLVEDNSTLSVYLGNWQTDLIRIYPSSGIVLESNPLSYELKNSSRVNSTTSESMARAAFTLNVTSIGLEGYYFEVATSLTLTIDSITPINETTNEIIAVVRSETGPVPNLNEENFKIDGATKTTVYPDYATINAFAYRIIYDGPISPTVEVQDQRGIRVVGFKS
jgi:hypothetical protein